MSTKLSGLHDDLSSLVRRGDRIEGIKESIVQPWVMNVFAFLSHCAVVDIEPKILIYRRFMPGSGLAAELRFCPALSKRR